MNGNKTSYWNDEMSKNPFLLFNLLIMIIHMLLIDYLPQLIFENHPTITFKVFINATRTVHSILKSSKWFFCVLILTVQSLLFLNELIDLNEIYSADRSSIILDKSGLIDSKKFSFQSYES